MPIVTLRLEGGPLDGLVSVGTYVFDNSEIFVVGPRNPKGYLEHCELCDRLYTLSLLNIKEWEKMEGNYKREFPGQHTIYWADPTRPYTYTTVPQMKKQGDSPK